MHLPLFKEGFLFDDCKIPFWIKIMLKFYKPIIPYPFSHENVRIAREKEKKMGTSFLGKFMSGKRREVHKIFDEKIPSQDYVLSTRIYVPNEEENLPTIIFYHGGGYVLGCIENYDSLCRNLCHFTQSIVVMTEYRLAPEFPFPAALDDAWNILGWVTQYIQKFQGNPENITLMGDSAGGGLAAVLGNEVIEKGFSNVKRQVLVYPWIDHHRQNPSHQKYGKNFGLTNDLLAYFSQCYVPKIFDYNNPHFSPLFSTKIQNAIPSLIFLASHDPLRDSGLQYATQLKKTGIETLCKIYQPTIHGFAQFYSVLPRGKEIFSDFLQTIKEWSMEK